MCGWVTPSVFLVFLNSNQLDDLNIFYQFIREIKKISRRIIRQNIIESTKTGNSHICCVYDAAKFIICIFTLKYYFSLCFTGQNNKS